MEVLIQYRVDSTPVTHRDLGVLTRRVVQAAFTSAPHSSPPEAEVSVLYVSDQEMRGLNQQYRRIDRPTDVLSFALNEAGDDPLAAGMLGDIVISFETAARQARRARRSLRQEVAQLLIHGSLHLIGFDHHAGKTRRDTQRTEEMQCLERECLEQLKAKLII